MGSSSSSSRGVQQAGRQGEALLPAARQLAGELTRALAEAKPLERAADRLSGLRHAVEAGDEIQILSDAEVLVQAEPLGHVATSRLIAALSVRMS